MGIKQNDKDSYQMLVDLINGKVNIGNEKINE
jgi:hypothetical protein